MSPFKYAPGLPPEVNERWSALTPILVAGRASSASGRKGRMDAVQDTHHALEQLAPLGVAVPPLPPDDVLEEMLRTAEPVWSFVDGKRIRHAFVVLDFRVLFGIVVLIATGSGLKIADDRTQPYVTRLAAEIRRVQPCLVFANRLDRMARRAWGIAPAMSEVEALDGYVGDRRRIVKVTGIEAIMVFFDIVNAQGQAEGLPTQTRDGMRSKTAREMTDGRMFFHVNVTPPPGFIALRLRTKENSHRGDRILVLDSPDHLPADGDVERGQPQLFDADGRHVDQVATVRWLLATIGTGGWSVERIAGELERRQFSNMTLVRWHGPTATVSRDRRSGAFSAVIKNLDVYETGCWTVRLGVDGYEDLELTGLIPPDGPWASPEDFERIRRWLRARAAREHRRARLVLGGHRCRHGDRTFKLRTAPSTPGKYNRPACYQLTDVFNGTRVAGTPHLDAAGLNKVLASSIAAAGDKALALTGTTVEVDPAVLELERDVQVIEREIAAALDRQAKLLVNVENLIDAGANGDMLRDLSARYDDLSKNMVPALNTRLETARASLTALEAEHAVRKPDLAAEALMRVVALLADPEDKTLRLALRSSLSELALAFERLPAHGRKAFRVTVDGELRVEAGGDEVVIPVHGTFDQGAVTIRNERVERIVAGLAAGIPLSVQKVPNNIVIRDLVAERLGLPQDRRSIIHCPDPRVLRVGIRLLLDPERRRDELAAELGEPVALLDAVGRALDARMGKTWLMPIGKGASLFELMALARANDGWIHRAAWVESGGRWEYLHGIQHARKTLLEPHGYGAYRVRECVHCHARALQVPRFHEAVGYVCASCELDAAGVRWPSTEYRRWLA